MKIGQVVKNVLYELSQQTWGPIRGLRSTNYIVEVTVDPKFAYAANILIRAGLNQSKNTKLEKIGCSLDNDIYISLTYYTQNNSDTPQADNLQLPNLLKNLEQDITDYIQVLASDWKESTLAIEELGSMKTIMYGDEMAFLEHGSSEQSADLLRKLAVQKGYYPEFLTIHQPRGSKKDYIVGKSDIVNAFISSLSEELSPSHYQVETAKNKKDETTLKKLCLKAISRYTLFYPDLFTIDKLAKDYGMPQQIIEEIEAHRMETAKNWDDLAKYKGKIVLYSTSSSYLKTKNYLLYPERIELNVGCISNFPIVWRSRQKGYRINRLMERGASNYLCELQTSRIKYSNFKIRLAMPAELDKIKAALKSSKCYMQGGGITFSDIDRQKTDYEKYAKEESKGLAI